jgi:hypothetical protein
MTCADPSGRQPLGERTRSAVTTDPRRRRSAATSAADPLTEHSCSQLMLAPYRGSRRADAVSPAARPGEAVVASGDGVNVWMWRDARQCRSVALEHETLGLGRFEVDAAEEQFEDDGR